MTYYLVLLSRTRSSLTCSGRVTTRRRELLRASNIGSQCTLGRLHPLAGQAAARKTRAAAGLLPRWATEDDRDQYRALRFYEAEGITSSTSRKSGRAVHGSPCRAMAEPVLARDWCCERARSRCRWHPLSLLRRRLNDRPRPRAGRKRASPARRPLHSRAAAGQQISRSRSCADRPALPGCTTPPPSCRYCSTAAAMSVTGWEVRAARKSHRGRSPARAVQLPAWCRGLQPQLALAAGVEPEI